jgi:hypothetical protein
MFSWLVIGLVVIAVEFVAELNHRPTLTATVRALPAWGRALVVAFGVALILHLVLPESWTRYDPIDRFEHWAHRRVDSY